MESSVSAHTLQGLSSSSALVTIESALRSGAILAHKDGNHGALYPKVDEFGPVGVPFLTAKLLSGGEVDIAAAPRLPDEHADKLRLGFVQPGDVLLSHNATIGRVAIVPPFAGRLLLGTSLTYFRVNREVISPRYLAAYFTGEHFQSQLRAVMSHTTRNQVPISAQRKLSIVLPPIEIQETIASTLGAFDDRIALLRETNATLEAIAQALFKSWFVDFDPVRAKQQCQSPAGMDEATVALFPGSFEDSALGLVPKGWCQGSVGDFAQMHRGSVNPGGSCDTWFEHFSLPAFDAGQMPVRELGAEIKSNKTSVPRDAVLLSKLNPHIPRVWLPVDAGPHAVCSTEFLVFVPAAGASREFAYCSFVAAPFQERLRQLVTGTSNSHQRVKPDSVLTLSTVVPPSPALEAFTFVVCPIFERVGRNRLQAQTLATLRDTLLPRLISGQLRLPEAEALLAQP